MDSLPWRQLCHQLQEDHENQDFPVRKYRKQEGLGKTLESNRAVFTETWLVCKKSWCPEGRDTNKKPSQKTSPKPQRNVWRKHSTKVGQHCFQTKLRVTDLIKQMESRCFLRLENALSGFWPTPNERVSSDHSGVSGCQEHLEPTLSPGGPEGPADPASPLGPLFPSSPLGPGGPWGPTEPCFWEKSKREVNRKNHFYVKSDREKVITFLKK